MRLHIKSLQRVASCSAMVLALTAAPAMLSPVVELGGSAHANEVKDSKYAKKKTKRVQAMSPQFGKKLTAIQEALDGVTDEKTEEVIKPRDLPKGRELLDAVKGRLTRYNKYEQASYWQMEAYYQYETENIGRSIKAYEEVLKLHDALPAARVAQTLKYVAQLYYLEENYRKAIEYLYEWMAITELVTAKDKVMLSQAHYQLKEMDKALRWIEEAITDYETEGKVPEENWWVIQKVIYYDKKNLHKVTEILEKLVTYYPKAKHWKQLGGMYAELGRDMDRLVAYDVLYLQGLLTKESRLRGLAYMYLGADVPYEAAQILEWGMDKGHIKKTSKNLKLLAESLYAAQEVKKSIPVMERAATLSDEGVLMERLVGMYLNDDQYDKAVKAAMEARRKGNLKRPDQNWLYQGMALASMKRYKDAEKAFKQAAKHEKTKTSATSWIKYLKTEKARDDEIKRSREALKS